MNEYKSFRIRKDVTKEEADQVLTIMKLPKVTREELLALAGGVLGLSVVISIAKAREASASPSPSPSPSPAPSPSPSTVWNVNNPRRGLYVPIYSPEMRTMTEQISPNLSGYPNLFTVNPNSGPAPISSRPDVRDNIIRVKQANPSTIVLGYVATGYANTQSSSDPFYTGKDKSVSALFTQAKLWIDDWGHLIDGIMEDEYRSDAFGLTYYRELNKLIRDYYFQKTGKYCVIRGNQGAPFQDKRHLSENLVDIASINENNFIPTADTNGENTLKSRTFNGEFPPHRFNWLTHSRASSTWTDAQYRLILKYCGTAYITDRTFGSNPWAAPSDSLQRQINIIRSIS